MESVNRFCKSLDHKDFEQIPPPIQKLFYAISIYCNIHHKGRLDVYQRVLQYYDHLLLSTGVYDRFYMTQAVGMKAAQFIPDHLKGKLKALCVQNIVKHYNVDPSSVYFYDDIPKTVGIVSKTSVNAVLINKGIKPEDIELLIRKKEFDPSSVKVVLLDFDKTISVQKVKKQVHDRDIDHIVDRFMGGWERVRALLANLKKLEEMGVHVGIITLNVRYRVVSLLQRIGWLPKTEAI